MRLKWRDGAATILTALMVAIAVAVISGWDWPLVGSERAAVGALGLIGIATCVVGGGSMTAFKGPFIAVASVLGTAALGLVIAGLVTGSETILVVLTVDIVALWLVATMRHSIEHEEAGTQRQIPHAA